MAIDFEAEGLLGGTSGRARDARLELLSELASQGVSLAELRRAVEEDRLALLPVERLFEGEGERLTSVEVAERAAVDFDLLGWLRQSLGLPIPEPDERAFTDEDVEAARRIRGQLQTGLPAEGLLEVSRVLGVAMAQLAAASRGLVGEAILKPGDTELDASRRYVAAAERLLPMIGPMLEYVFEHHLREQLRHDAIGAAELRDGRLAGSQEVTVCFGDLVGFTKLGEQVPPEDLGAVTGRLNELAGAVANPPVRLVKLIGDAVMLVSRETDPLLDAALELVDATEAAPDVPQLRAGVARGAAVTRSGDWYGRPVNMASRITAIAYPGSVLASEAVHEVAPGGYRWSFAGARRLKGIGGQVKLYRVRHDREDGSRRSG
ncbi:MAG: adenylate cyclase regulatory domain-containing protein [Solirubrobacterales bacterium]